MTWWSIRHLGVVFRAALYTAMNVTTWISSGNNMNHCSRNSKRVGFRYFHRKYGRFMSRDKPKATRKPFLVRTQWTAQLSSESVIPAGRYSEKSAKNCVSVEVQDYDTQLVVSPDWYGRFGRELSRCVHTSKGFLVVLVLSRLTNCPSLRWKYRKPTRFRFDNPSILNFTITLLDVVSEMKITRCPPGELIISLIEPRRQYKPMMANI